MWNATKLSRDNYIRPEQTYTDKLTIQEIEEKLQDYIQVDMINEVSIGTHLRYFMVKDGKRSFRLGGLLICKTPNYVVISNGVKSWNVPIEDTIFYKKITVNEIRQMYQKKIDSLEDDIKILKDENTKLNIKLNLINKLK